VARHRPVGASAVARRARGDGGVRARVPCRVVRRRIAQSTVRGTTHIDADRTRATRAADIRARAVAPRHSASAGRSTSRPPAPPRSLHRARAPPGRYSERKPVAARTRSPFALRPHPPHPLTRTHTQQHTLAHLVCRSSPLQGGSWRSTTAAHAHPRRGLRGGWEHARARRRRHAPCGSRGAAYAPAAAPTAASKLAAPFCWRSVVETTAGRS